MINNTNLPCRLYQAQQVRELDQRAINQHAIAGITLMRRAAQAVLDAIVQQWPNLHNISIYCGTGNNGGDGYILAGLAKRKGFTVQLIQVGNPQKLKNDALLAKLWAQDEGIIFTPWSSSITITGQLLIDAMLGTGIIGKVKEPYSQAITQINSSHKPIVAVDISSGLCSDTGAILGDAIIADLTISFIGLKQGLLTGDGPACCGQLKFASLDISTQIFNEVNYSAQRIDSQILKQYLIPRSKTAHKGQFGHVLIIGGNIGMGGAAIMAAEAANRTGAGLVSLITHPKHVPAALVRCPEIMTISFDDKQKITKLIKQASVLVIGPGLGTDAYAKQLLKEALTSNKPLVVDADALNLLSTKCFELPQHNNWIITPHPGEAARLLSVATNAIQHDRFNTSINLQKKFNATVILKGAGTIICTSQQPLYICSDGNPGMATGGMGDILSGILGGLLAQGFSAEDAAKIGVCLHAASADKAAIDGERGMRASDLLPWIRILANP